MNLNQNWYHGHTENNTYYASIILDAFFHPFFQNYVGIIGKSLEYACYKENYNHIYNYSYLATYICKIYIELRQFY